MAERRRPGDWPGDEKPVPADAIVGNVFRCSWCEGPVDRFEHCFACRNCGAVGSLVTGIMMRIDYDPGEGEDGG